MRADQTGQGEARILPLDAARGFALVGMVAANTASAVTAAFPGGDVYPTLRHARWEGIHYADIVYPLFLFLIGLSIALSMADRRGGAIPWSRLLRRTGLLIVLGLVVSAVPLLAQTERSLLVVDGTLQRIGVTYFAAALLFLRVSSRARAWLCIVVLIGYAIALEWLPFPGVGPSDLSVRNLNVAAWFDLVIIGARQVVPGPDGIPTRWAGALLSLPATAVLPVLGTLAGEWMRPRINEGLVVARGFAGAGLVLIGVGGLASLMHPMVKAIWTSSFVLVTAGVALLTMAGFTWLFHVHVDRRVGVTSLMRFLMVLGRNSITAYLVHVVAVILVTITLRGFYGVLTTWVPPKIAAFAIIGAVLAIVYAPTAWLSRRGRTLRL